MSQPAITSFFNSRKRAATEDLVSSKNKIQVHENSQATPHSGSTLKNVKLLSSKKETTVSSDVDIVRSKRGRAVAKLCFDDSTDQSVSSSNHLNPQSDNQKSENDEKSVELKNLTISAFVQKQNAANIAKNAKTDSLLESRKELSLGDIKAKLLGNSRLAELKAAADKFSRNYKLLKENTGLKEFKSIDVEVPTSPNKRAKLQDVTLSPKKTEPETVSTEKCVMSPRKVVISPVKSPSKVPAYIRHASLVTKATSLPLPHHYRALAEIFRGMEQVASLLYNRKEKITFTKLRPSVQEMLKKNFSEKHLKQIKYVVPEFYSFDVEKVKTFSASAQKQQYDLLLVPILPPGVTQMSPNQLLERRRKFFERLTELVKQHHAKFLSKLNPPMQIPDNKLVRWHPEFELEKVPEVNESTLPHVPGRETYSTAEDVLAKAKQLFSCNTRMEKALEKLAEAKARGLTDQEKIATGLTDGPRKTDNAVPSTSNVTIINPALRNLPAALLEKVKAKQAAKALEAMTRTPDDEKKYMVYSRLPDLARTMRNIFVTERKNVLALNVVLSKLDSSFQGRVSELDLRGDIELLAREFPDWLSSPLVRNVKYLKLDREASLETIKQKLQSLADQYKN